MDAFLVLLVFAAFCILIFMVAEKEREKRSDKLMQYPRRDEFDKIIPPYLFPRTPYEISEAFKHSPNMQEGLTEWVDLILKDFPEGPTDAADRDKREIALWDILAARYTNGDGTITKPKQYIIDDFLRNEKWIFRLIYAVTGDVHKSIWENEFLELQELKRDAEGYGLVDRNESRDADRAITKYETKADQFKDRRKQHEKEWGERYYYHIEKRLNSISRETVTDKSNDGWDDFK